MEDDGHRGRVAFVLATAAVAWAALLVAAAFFVPAYSESCGGTATTCTGGGRTLLEANGGGVVLWLGLVCGLAACGWLLLHARCAVGLPGAAGIAQLCSGALFVFSLLTGFSIGLFVLPVPVLLFAASVRTPQGTQSAPR